MSGAPPAASRPARSARTALRAMPSGIWAMGLGSLFMDTSSELIHSLLPVFMVTVLGTSMLTVGLIEGVAEATAAIMKAFSGALSDLLRRRKLLMISGYALSALTKPIFPLAGTIGWVFGARFLDRVGKGIRGAPRDALVADISPAHLRGAAYGLRQALDSIGALLGPLLAVLFMLRFADNLRKVMWVGVVPALIAVVVLIAWVHDPDPGGGESRPGSRLTAADARRLPPRYWLVVAAAAVFTLARFSEAFLVLRARDVGIGLGYVPLVMIVMNVFYAGAAYPAGAIADRVSARVLLEVGLALLVAADLVLALAHSPAYAYLGTVL